MFSRLERLGQVPEGDNEYHDWELAQTTTWWGKPLEPKKFWKGRVLWNDGSANSDALRHGRLYPPMPYEDTNLPPYPNDEGIHGGGSLDGPNIFYASSSTERAFWDRFDKDSPSDHPDMIEQEQSMAAFQLLRGGFPPAAFTTNALFWAYVQEKRADYQKELDSGGQKHERGFQIFMSNFLSNLLVDSKYVTEPLSPDQIKAANAWKVAYLQRLQREKVDEQYIKAYMQAWKLSEEQVFSSTN